MFVVRRCGAGTSGAVGCVHLRPAGCCCARRQRQRIGLERRQDVHGCVAGRERVADDARGRCLGTLGTACRRRYARRRKNNKSAPAVKVCCAVVLTGSCWDASLHRRRDVTHARARLHSFILKHRGAASVHSASAGCGCCQTTRSVRTARMHVQQPCCQGNPAASSQSLSEPAHPIPHSELCLRRSGRPGLGAPPAGQPTTHNRCTSCLAAAAAS